jgi:hypothetical protein
LPPFVLSPAFFPADGLAACSARYDVRSLKQKVIRSQLVSFLVRYAWHGLWRAVQLALLLEVEHRKLAAALLLLLLLAQTKPPDTLSTPCFNGFAQGYQQPGNRTHKYHKQWQQNAQPGHIECC